MANGSRVLFLLALLASHGVAHAAGNVCAQRSSALLDALRGGDYAAATKHFDARMHAALDAAKLGGIWTQTLPAQFGAFDKSAKPHLGYPKPGFTLVRTPLHFAGGWLEMRVACSSDGKITGLFFAPGSPPPDADDGPGKPGAGNGGPHAHGLSVSTPLGALPGTLLVPAGNGPFPAVLLVAGSGPNDRDETIGPNKPFRDIARGLLDRGIASYRYDKRTRVYGAQMKGTAITVDDEVTDDAVAAVGLLARQPHIDADRIFVLGHSLGALMAPRIAARAPSVAGVILLAAPVALNLDVVLRQVRYIGKVEGESAKRLKSRVEPIIAARDAIAQADPARPPSGEFFHAPASYWLSLRNYNPLRVAEKLHQPMLILQGGGDYQVTPKHDFSAWRHAFAGSRRVTLREFPGLSHLFMPAGHPPSPADYARAGHVDPAVIASISAWIESVADKRAG